MKRESTAVRRDRRTLAVLTAVCLVLAGYLTWRLFQPTLAEEALAHLRALIDGNGRAMVSAATLEERRDCAVTPERMQRVLDELVMPRLKKVSVVGDESVRQHNDPVDEAVASVHYRLPDGSTEHLAVDMWFTESGGKRSVLLHTLYGVWYIDKRLAAGHPLSTVEQVEAYLEGLRKDRQKLQEIGVTGLYWPEFGARTWGQIESSLMTQLERSKAEAEKA